MAVHARGRRQRDARGGCAERAGGGGSRHTYATQLSVAAQPARPLPSHPLPALASSTPPDRFQLSARDRMTRRPAASASAIAASNAWKAASLYTPGDTCSREMKQLVGA